MTAENPLPRIVVAEGDFLTATLLMAAIEASGRRAVVGRDGESALEAVERHAPALVILDMNVARPGALQILRALRRREDRPAILALLRTGQTKLRLQARTLGVNSFLELPFSTEELQINIARLCR